MTGYVWPRDIESWYDVPPGEGRSMRDVCTVNDSGPNLWRWALLLAVIIAASLVGDLCRGAETVLRPAVDPNPVVQRVLELPAGYVRTPLGGYVLGRSGGLAGQGDGGQTIVLPLPKAPGSIVSSEGLEKWRASGRGQWAYEGVPTGTIVRDLIVDGRGDVPPNPQLGDKRPRGAAAIDLYSPGARVERVKVFDHAGVGLVVGHGTAPMVGKSDVTESAVIRIEDFKTNRTHAGLWVTSTADGIADDLEFVDVRDFGARFDGAAWTISRVHAAGVLAAATAENPDAGVGIINGSYANYYGEGIQADNCRIGFRNYGAATCVDGFVGKLCRETTVHAVKKLRIKRLSIETPGGRRWMGDTFNPASRVIVIEPAAAGTILGDELSEWTTDDATQAIYCTARASRSEIRNARSSWFYSGLGSNNTVVEYGSATEKLWGSRIDVWANGASVGVRLTHLIGRGNVIVVHHNGNCATPIDLGPNKDLVGNDVRIENASEWGGTWTVLAKMEDSAGKFYTAREIDLLKANVRFEESTAWWNALDERAQEKVARQMFHLWPAKEQE